MNKSVLDEKKTKLNVIIINVTIVPHLFLSFSMKFGVLYNIECLPLLKLSTPIRTIKVESHFKKNQSTSSSISPSPVIPNYKTLFIHSIIH
jgi:hypothetical protein